VYRAIDLLCLPSYREGFPVTLLEAAAMQLPVVATDIPGCVDAVDDGVTGLLCAPRDADALRTALGTAMRSEELRRRMGRAARARVLEHFAQQPLWSQFHDEYRAATLAVRTDHQPRGLYARHVKRILDVAMTALALVLLAPLLLLVWLMVTVLLGRPVLFRQVRPGLGGHPFEVLKFRTMTDARDESGRPLPDADRLTRFGRFLRSTSLDELPELWNVLKGEMSLVGPRPLLVQYLGRYTPVQARRHEARPGITGLAQVRGRNAISWERKFELDVEYVDQCSFFLDMEILARTVHQVVVREGISPPGHATAEEFMGTGAR
jgi:lipopolysaccharide/colanic/teichoic acid biosynthesis glycosyltransferase